ncbi:hypothetical protein E2C01_091300 [Portunus trituberculatus]|uniref:Uncharacterized protein n=1 Tax=Portunus trituberculatus TaxID=210409 RepID=A0A5B7JNN7_PORTR|nr:hypothetical protein [Portunus trituberculatus]
MTYTLQDVNNPTPARPHAVHPSARRPPARLCLQSHHPHCCFTSLGIEIQYSHSLNSGNLQREYFTIRSEEQYRAARIQDFT